MANHNIDQIIKSKVENINFEFKDEYWTQMEEKISSKSSGSASSGAVGASSYLSTFLIVSVSIIVTLLAIYLWFFSGDSNQRINNSTPTETPIELTVGSEPATETTKEKHSLSNPDPLCDGDVVEEEIEVVDQVEPKPKKQKVYSPSASSSKINSKKDSQKVEEPKVIETSLKQEPKKKVATSIETYDTTIKHEVELEKEINQEPKIESQVVEIDKGTDSYIDDEEIYTNQTISLDNDSVHIPDAKLLGDDQNEVIDNGQVSVEAGPKQIKTVKPKNKPVKHVFNKRKGFLYRIGLRK